MAPLHNRDMAYNFKCVWPIIKLILKSTGITPLHMSVSSPVTMTLPVARGLTVKSFRSILPAQIVRVLPKLRE